MEAAKKLDQQAGASCRLATAERLDHTPDRSFSLQLAMRRNLPSLPIERCPSDPGYVIVGRSQERRVTVVFRFKDGRKHADRLRNRLWRIVELDLRLHFRNVMPVSASGKQLSACAVLKGNRRLLPAREKQQNHFFLGVHKQLEMFEFREPSRTGGVQSFGDKRAFRRKISRHYRSRVQSSNEKSLLLLGLIANEFAPENTRPWAIWRSERDLNAEYGRRD